MYTQADGREVDERLSEAGGCMCESILGSLSAFGSGGVSLFELPWCPDGLHDGYRQAWTLNYFYTPHYLADRNYWYRD
jgi:hypothetical protein